MIDRAAHREGLPLVYNTYVPVTGDAASHEDDLRALLQPLLATSYLLFDWLKDNRWFGAEQIVIKLDLDEADVFTTIIQTAIDATPVLAKPAGSAGAPAGAPTAILALVNVAAIDFNGLHAEVAFGDVEIGRPVLRTTKTWCTPEHSKNKIKDAAEVPTHYYEIPFEADSGVLLVRDGLRAEVRRSQGLKVWRRDSPLLDGDAK